MVLFDLTLCAYSGCELSRFLAAALGVVVVHDKRTRISSLKPYARLLRKLGIRADFGAEGSRALDVTNVTLSDLAADLKAAVDAQSPFDIPPVPLEFELPADETEITFKFSTQWSLTVRRLSKDPGSSTTLGTENYFQLVQCVPDAELRWYHHKLRLETLARLLVVDGFDTLQKYKFSELFRLIAESSRELSEHW